MMNTLQIPIQALKRGLISKFNNLIFTLLGGFEGEINQYTLNIYMTITFILIDYYMNIDLR